MPLSEQNVRPGGFSEVSRENPGQNYYRRATITTMTNTTTDSASALHVVVAIPFTQEQRSRLEQAASGAHFAYSGKDIAADIDVAAADIVMGNLPHAQLATAHHLQWIQLASAGADAYTIPGAIPAKVQLTNCVGAYGQAVSEHMLAMLLSLMKNLPLYRDNQSKHLWENRGAVTSLVDAKVMVLGLGDIGRQFARLSSALGAHVTGVKRTVTLAPEGVEHVITLDQTKAVLPDMDIVVSFLPGGAPTQHLLDQEFFAAMKQGSYFLNGGRGSVVDTTAAREALASGHLAGLGVDVTDPEPLPLNDPLWDIPNALITPHIAGGYQLPATLDNVSRICAENLSRFISGNLLKNLVEHS